MTGEKLFAQMGNIDEEFILEAEQYKRKELREQYKKQLLPLAASVCLCVFTVAKRGFLR